MVDLDSKTNNKIGTYHFILVVLCCFARPCRYSVYPDVGSDQFLYIQEGNFSLLLPPTSITYIRGKYMHYGNTGLIDIYKKSFKRFCNC